MKAAFGGQYGISLTLAPDYWYLRGFDAKAMEPYVDFFGFMAYDLHGFWVCFRNILFPFCTIFLDLNRVPEAIED